MNADYLVYLFRVPKSITPTGHSRTGIEFCRYLCVGGQVAGRNNLEGGAHHNAYKQITKKLIIFNSN